MINDANDKTRRLMPNKLFRITTLIIVSMCLISSGMSAAIYTGSIAQGGKSDDQKYVGTWAGTYTTENGPTNQLSYTFTKDDKGKWGGKINYTNQDGEQTAEFKSLDIADGKMKAKIESPDGQVEVTIEGKFEGDNLEGTYAVIPKGQTEPTEKGSWKVTRTTAKKTE
jgi:hypothetical protein